MMQQFYSNGKLLITGEYLVLNGAKALAVSLKTGQKMEVTKNGINNQISWKSFFGKECWFDATIELDSFRIKDNLKSGNPDYIRNLLMAAQSLNPDFLLNGQSLLVENNLGFSPDWGFGSSSTLISNLAYWANVDPFELNKLVSKGSGYDIACARSQSPILYQNHKNGQSIEPVKFNPPFSESLYLVWLGNKKSTEQSIDYYLEHKRPSQNDLYSMSQISEAVSSVSELKQFKELLSNHNQLMENVLQVTSVQKQYFSDFDGIIKSLGAWGGDFILVVSELPLSKIKLYFKNKGLLTFFAWNELVIDEFVE